MGNLLERVLNVFGSKDARMLMVGLDAGGKTTVLYQLKLGECVHTIPTVGFSVETVKYKNLNLTIWVSFLFFFCFLFLILFFFFFLLLKRMLEVKIRFVLYGIIIIMVRDYFLFSFSFSHSPFFFFLFSFLTLGCKGVIFVVDSNDKERFAEAAEELHMLLRADELRDASLLVFANKQDLPNACNVTQIADKLGLHALTEGGRQWHVQGSQATTGRGLVEGLEWMARNI